MPYEKVLSNGIIISKNKFVKILKVLPISYELKSDLEKEAILEAYKLFLRSCNFDIQFIIQSKKENINKVLKNLENTEDENLKLIQENYKKYIFELSSNKNCSSKNFYILISISKRENTEMLEIEEIFNDNILKIKETLSKCGNKIVEIKEKELIENVIKTFFKVKA